MSKKPQKDPVKKGPAESTLNSYASKVGQMIGDAFATVVFEYIQEYLKRQSPDYILLSAQDKKKEIRLKMLGGTARQIDGVIGQLNSDDPIVLLESKWLKDGRHHNDKGAWILQLKEIQRHHPTIRGAIANLLGFWTEGARLMIKSEGRVVMVLVATDQQVYSTIEPVFNNYLTSNNRETVTLDAVEIRSKIPNHFVEALANCLTELKESGQLKLIAKTWLNLEREYDNQGKPRLGKDLIESAIGKILEPLPEFPRIVNFEIALEIESGNVIYQEFKDMEEAREFLETYTQQPQAILDKIMPRTKTPKSTQLPLSIEENQSTDNGIDVDNND